MRQAAALGAAGLLLLAACGAGESRPPDLQLAGGPALEPRPDWTTALAQLLPGIQTCIAEGGQPAIAVTKAWPIGENLTGVRLLMAGGERLDCVAGADGTEILLTERVWTVSQLPGEREPLFTPASAGAPAGSACIAVAEARDAAGGDVGWLSYDVCRQPRQAGAAAAVVRPEVPARRGGNG